MLEDAKNGYMLSSTLSRGKGESYAENGSLCAEVFQIPLPNRSERWSVTCVIKRGIYGCLTTQASACFPQMYPTELIYLDPIECSPGSYAALFVLKIIQQANAIPFSRLKECLAS